MLIILQQMKVKVYSYLVLLLLFLQLFVIVSSWLFSAIFPDANINSLISSEGIRWFSSNYVDILASPCLVWIIMISIAYGALKQSGVLYVLKRNYNLKYRERIAIYFMLFVMIVYIIVVMSFILMPRAILLSATGEIWPSPFSLALVPIVSIGICLFSVVYSIVSGNAKNITFIIKSFIRGIACFAPVILLYVLVTQLYHLINYAFNQGDNLVIL